MTRLFCVSATVLSLVVTPTIAQTSKVAGATVETLYAPSGQVMAIVKCSNKPSKCMKAASAICNGPYQVLDSESHAGGLIADILPGPVSWYSMSLTCGKSDGQMPTFRRRGPEWNPPSYVHCNAYGGSILCTGW